MKRVTLEVDLLVGSVHKFAGESIEIDNDRANELVQNNWATFDEMTSVNVAKESAPDPGSSASPPCHKIIPGIHVANTGMLTTETGSGVIPGSITTDTKEGPGPDGPVITQMPLKPSGQPSVARKV